MGKTNKKSILFFIFIFLLLIYSIFISAKTFFAPINSTTYILAQTNSSFLVTAINGTAPYTFTNGSCVTVTSYTNNSATYLTSLSESTCNTTFQDSLETMGYIQWYIHDYVCDGCSQWTAGLFWPFPYLLPPNIDNRPWGEGPDWEPEDPWGEGPMWDVIGVNSKYSFYSRLNFIGWAYNVSIVTEPTDFVYNYSVLLLYDLIDDENNIDLYAIGLTTGDWTKLSATQDQGENTLTITDDTDPRTYILGENIQIATEVECHDGSSWINCENIQDGNYLTQVRVTCDDPYDRIIEAYFNLYNSDTQVTEFDSSSSSSEGNQWVYDNTDVLIEEFDDLVLNVICTDSRSQNSKISLEWNIYPAPEGEVKFNVSNITGSSLALFDDDGNLILKGICSAQEKCIAPSDSFIIQNSSGDTVSYIDVDGNLCIQQSSCTDESPSCNAPANSLIIVNESQTVSYMDTNGNLCLVGRLYQQYLP